MMMKKKKKKKKRRRKKKKKFLTLPATSLATVASTCASFAGEFDLAND